jgi:hypothetical protein
MSHIKQLAVDEAESQIDDNDENWENGTLGCDSQYVCVSEDDEGLIDESLDLKFVSLRMKKTLIEDLKQIAEIYGVNYKTVIRQVLENFAKNNHK